MKKIKVIKDLDSFQLLADDTRRRIIHLLRAKEHTVAQIADELQMTPQAIYHHIRKLKEGGLVEIAREERIDHFIETYYRAAAEVFYCAHGEGTKVEEEVRVTADAFKRLQKLGIEVSSDPEAATKVTELQKKMKELCHDEELDRKLNELDDIDLFTQQGMLELACLATMSDEDFEQYIDAYRQLRALLSPTRAGINKDRKKR